MTDLTICHVPGCFNAPLLICEHCARQLCGPHYGAGSSSRCGRCFRAIAAEQGVADELTR